MIELMAAHPWMTFVILLVLVASVSFQFTIPLNTGGDSVARWRELETRCELQPIEWSVTTPDEARMRMLTPRQRVAKEIAHEMEEFIDRGNPNATLIRPLDPELEDVDLVIAELLEYQAVGWNVQFSQGCASISLPPVVS